jgi:hypothetical protein
MFLSIIRSEDFKENGKLNRDKRKSTLSSSSDASGENETPTKAVSTVQTFSINCQVHFIDFEGRSDIESVVKMLQEVCVNLIDPVIFIFIFLQVKNFLLPPIRFNHIIL